jgi:hypothetical protein
MGLGDNSREDGSAGVRENGNFAAKHCKTTPFEGLNRWLALLKYFGIIGPVCVSRLRLLPPPPHRSRALPCPVELPHGPKLALETHDPERESDRGDGVVIAFVEGNRCDLATASNREGKPFPKAKTSDDTKSRRSASFHRGCALATEFQGFPVDNSQASRRKTSKWNGLRRSLRQRAQWALSTDSNTPGRSSSLPARE